MRRSFIFFLRRNWGFGFIFIFIILILLSVIELDFGAAGFSDRLALDGFYFLVIGIVLQVISTLTYRRLVIDQSSVNNAKKFESTGRFKVMFSFAIIAVLAISAVGVYSGALTNSASLLTGYTTLSTQTITKITYTGFQAKVFFSKILPEPENESLVTFGVVATGGVPPYEYEAVWSDGLTQSNDYGTFSRTIQQGESIPSSATVTVASSNGKNVTFIVQIPRENLSTSVSQSEASLTFVEVGLAPTRDWSVELDGSNQSSKSSEIVFPNLKSGNYNFSISYQYNGSFNSAFNYTPRTGSITVNGSNEVQNVSFVAIPTDQLATPSAAPTFSLGNGSAQILISYKDNLQVALNATAVMIVNDSSGRMVSTFTTELDLRPGVISQGSLDLSTLGIGNYTSTLYLLYSNGEAISPESTLNFTIN